MVQLSDDRLGPMFRDRSLNRADIATDLAIPLLAKHGWAGLTLAGVAASGTMRRQSVTQWFGSGDAFREQVAWRYAHRWVALLSSQLAVPRGGTRRSKGGAAAPTPGRRRDRVRPDLAHDLEAGRCDAVAAAAAAFGEFEQHAMVEACLSSSTASEIRAVNALVTGLRTQLCGLEPVSLSDAFAATAILRR